MTKISLLLKCQLRAHVRNEVVRGAVQEISHSGKCRGASETHLGMFVRRSSEDSAQKVLARSDCVDEPTACAAPPTNWLALKFLEPE